MPARGIGMSAGSGTHGAPHAAASSAELAAAGDSTTMRAPAAAASVAASTVSSVLPENDDGEARACASPTKVGQLVALRHDDRAPA